MKQNPKGFTGRAGFTPEEKVLEKSGVRKFYLPPADAKKVNDIAYQETWKQILRDDPIYGPQFKKLMVR